MYERSYSVGADYESKLAANRDIVNQFIEADKLGLKKMTLYVSSSGGGLKWVGQRYANTLYHHHVISFPISTTVVVDRQKNIIFHEK